MCWASCTSLPAAGTPLSAAVLVVLAVVGWLVGCVARCDAGSRLAHWNAETCGLARHRCVSLLWMDVMRTGWRSRVTLVKAYGFLATGVVRCILFYSGCFVFYMGLSKLSTVLQQAVSL